jgi:hypothetical protein
MLVASLRKVKKREEEAVRKGRHLARVCSDHTVREVDSGALAARCAAVRWLGAPRVGTAEIRRAPLAQ